MLRSLEKTHLQTAQMSLWGLAEPEVQVVEKIVEKQSEVEQLLKNIDVNNLTPMEALNKLSELKSNIK
jgi:predicted transcriptional regulator